VGVPFWVGVVLIIVAIVALVSRRLKWPLATAVAVLGVVFTAVQIIQNATSKEKPAPGAVSSPTATVTPSASGGGTGTIGSDGSSGIYHRGTLKLAFDTCADLDAAPTDPQWGEPSANPDAGGADLCSESPSFVGVNSATLVTVNSGTHTTCQNATGWLAPNLYQDLHLSVGSFVCVHTNQGRYSLLRVDAINSTTNAITFWVKTFKKPGD
jgi:hypothetical protein